MLWNVFFVFLFSAWLKISIEGQYQPPKGSFVWGYFTPPVLQQIRNQPRRTALEAMVDLTNNLGVAILQDHSFSRSNFAFSPYGVASVLVVLYEGARGESAKQIQRAVRFPADKDIIRIGFRDIHRHLRNYFSHEGYLSGISLNKDSSSLKSEYKKILRFYGYDVDLNQSLDDEDEFSSENPTSEASSTAAGVTSQPSANVSEITTPKIVTNLEESEKEQTTSSIVDASVTPTAEKDTETATETTLLPTTFHSPDEDFSPGPTRPAENGHENEINNLEILKSTTSFDEKVTLSTEPATADESQINLTTENCQGGEKEIEACGKEFYTGATTEFEQNEVLETQSGDQEESLSSATTAPLFEDSVTKAKKEENDATAIANLDNGMLIPQPDDQTTKGTTFAEAKSPAQTSSPAEATSSVTTEANKQKEESRPRNDMRMEVKNDIKMSSTKEKVSLKSIRSLINTKMALWLNKPQKKLNPRKKRTIKDYLKSPRSPDLSLQLQNGMYDTHVSRNADLYRSLPRLLFLVDGAVDTPVPMMTYTNVFNYAYVPRLHSKALEFPLDDIRYKLLILLPVERRGLRQLIYDLAGFPLCDVLGSVRPARVKVMIPTFMVEGFVILTSSLQKLGIWDVFDPRKANLSGMTTDPDLYVRNVEQSVTVVIRNYVEILDIQTRTMAARDLEQEFEATHPFLYFVLDTDTNVALMAGQILDPLNSRIY